MSDSDGFETGLPEADEVPPDVESSRQTWTELEQQQAQLQDLPTETGVGGVLIDRGYAITFFDARAYVLEQADQLQITVPPLVEDPPRCFFFRVRNKPVHIDAWQKIYKISKVSFQEDDLTHHRILNSLHSLMTGCKAAPLRRGSHWQPLGFQSDDPITDLRATGMLGLLMPLQLFAKFQTLGQKVLRVSRLADQDFPLMIVLILFTSAAIEAAGMTRVLKTGDSFVSCWEEMALLFAGMVADLCVQWEQDACDYQHDFQRFDRIANRAKSRPMEAVQRGRKAVEERQPAKPELVQDD
jgi:hypothetical protein